MGEHTAKHEKLFKLAKLSLEEITTLAKTNDGDEIETCVEKVSTLIKRLENSVEKTKDTMIDGDIVLEEIVKWSNLQTERLNPFREVRSRLKQAAVDKQRSEDEIALQREIQKQRAINEEVKRANSISSGVTESLQSVKLQKYTITAFNGDYKDWTRFWNQFSVEVDGAKISEISKFNYLLELTKGKPREDILGLPHTKDGYIEAKRILQSTYGKDIKVQRALIKELENLPAITSTRRIASIHEFYNKLARVVRTLSTMEKLASCQGMVYTILDKLGPVREILAQSDDKWEEWKLEELTDNLRKYVERNPLDEEHTKYDNRDRAENRRERSFLGNGQERGKTKCVYCGDENHKSFNCTKVLRIADRREILKNSKLCYNCTGKGHTATKCRSRNCSKCGQRHHTSLCEERAPKTMDQDVEKKPENQKQATEKNLGGSCNDTATLHPYSRG